jgi:hypothetical protein
MLALPVALTRLIVRFASLFSKRVWEVITHGIFGIPPEALTR